MNRSIRLLSNVAVAAVIFGAVSCASAVAQGPGVDESPSFGPLSDVRNGGAVAESYAYHRGGPAPGTISPACGWYHYGFPVSSYRWGWFGAEHYYPTVWCHTGYYGDCNRVAYRCGY
jgi:hypothetical protein